MSDKILRVSNIDAMVNRIKTHVEEINHTNEEIKNLAGEKVNELVSSGTLQSQIITDKSINASTKIINGSITKELLDPSINLGVEVGDEQIQTIVQEKVQQLVASGELEVQPIANNSVDLNKLSQEVFGNTYIVDANAEWFYTCFYLDTSAIPTASQYEYNVSLEISYDPETQGTVGNIGMASQDTNNGTNFKFTIEELTNKDKKYFLNLNETNDTLHTMLKLSSNGANSKPIFKTTIENICVSINGVNVPIIKCEARSQGSNVGTVTYTPAEKRFIASIEDVKAVNDNIDNIKVDRYSFSEDLLLSDEDNCINTTSINGTFSVGFDFEEEVTDPEEIEFQFCYAEDNTFPIKRISYFPILETARFTGGSTDFLILADMKDNPNRIHKLTAKPKGTGRYWGVYIWGTPTGLTHFRILKAKYKGRYLKCIKGSTQPFSDNRIMNYGIYSNEENKKIKYKGKTIIGFGDSLTFGENGATQGRGIMYHIGRNFPYSTTINEGHNGARSESLFSSAKKITDYRDVIAALICYGMNDGGATGAIDTSIPQLTCQGLKDVITTGITVNDTLIDTEDKYFALFKNDWYGNMAKGIEYVNFYNPMTQIYLHSPHSSDQWTNHQALCEAITRAMKELASYYSIPFIDTHGELGINNRNSHFYRLDWAHLGDLGNEIKGNFLANQIESKLLAYPYDEKEYAVKSLTMNRETETVAVESSIYLYVKVAPYNATNKNIIWSTDNENVTIEQSVIGLEWQKVKVTGVTAGETIITATSEDSAFTATCTVTIS